VIAASRIAEVGYSPHAVRSHNKHADYRERLLEGRASHSMAADTARDRADCHNSRCEHMDEALLQRRARRGQSYGGMALDHQAIAGSHHRYRKRVPVSDHNHFDKIR